MHIPVMKNEVIKYLLNVFTNSIYIDCTFGSGGHSQEILSKLDSNSKLFTIDKDLLSFKFVNNIKDKRIIHNHCSFVKISNILKKYNLIGKVNGILLDLGLSNCQINDLSRGFTFNKDGILDMRMDITSGVPAYEWLKKAKISDIEYIFKNFGEEYKYSYNIAKHIYMINRYKTIINSIELVNIINKFHKKKTKKNRATKYFQSIRIFINNELNEIKQILLQVINILKDKGRLVILSFNSLESKIIKKFHNFNKSIFIDNINKNNNKKYFMKKIIKLKPTKNEIFLNKKSKNAILTVFEKQIIK